VGEQHWRCAAARLSLSVIEVPGHRATRVIVGEPGAADRGLIAALLSGREAGGRVVIEDCFARTTWPRPSG